MKTWETRRFVKLYDRSGEHDATTVSAVYVEADTKEEAIELFREMGLSEREVKNVWEAKDGE